MRYLWAVIAVLALCVPAVCDEYESARQVIDKLQTAIESIDWQWRYIPGDVSQAKDPSFDDSSYKEVKREAREVGYEPVGWLRATITVPDKVRGFSVEGGWVRMECGIDDEGTIYVDGNKIEDFLWDGGSAFLTKSAKPGQKIVVAIQCRNTGGPLGLLYARIEFERLNKMDTAIRRLSQDFTLCQHLISMEPEAKRPALASTLVNAITAIDAKALESGRDADLIASLDAAQAKIKPILDLVGNFTIHMVGHAHIDMNWLWLWPETLDVCRNTFSTAAKLMDEFPGFVFSQSQPATYHAMQETAPEVFATIKDRIKRGTWDAVATTWTEGDNNMSSGESIVRSILYGKRYMKKQFGVESDVFWMPDTFGHPWTLPQILAKSGIKYYYFMRCNPGHTLFWWQGPEGSRVLAFSSGYSSDINSAGLLRDAMAVTSEIGVPHYMRVYGVGDHGGGPTKGMLQRTTEMQANPAYPKLKFSTVSDYFRTVLKTGKDFPVWKTEMNTTFEGCYTTHADIKRWNRESENLLTSAEKFSSIANVRFRTPYPVSEFEHSWRNTAFNQFHDLLCGSAIHGSYDYSRNLYEEARAQAGGALYKATDAIVRKIKTKGPGTPIVVFNSLSWPRTDIVSVASPFPGQSCNVAVKDESGKVWPGRSMGDRLSFTAHGVPAMGYKVFWVSKAAKPVASGIKADENTIENQFFRVRVNPDQGLIESIYDKTNKREIVPKDSPAGLLQILMEEPHGMSAWSIGPIVGNEDLRGETEVVLMDSGPASATITFDREFRDSQFTQSVTLHDSVPRIDMRISADWQEIGTAQKPSPMLKAAFPTTLTNPKATFEIPFGSIERPAKGAEVPALKWIDLSEPGYGVSLLNDCKYGFDANGGTMRATLLRASYEPDPTPDQGLHEMLLSIYPHKGDWRAAGTVRRGFEVNEPLTAVVASAHVGSLPASQSFVSVNAPNVVVTALKRAEDDNSFILRFYEAHGTSGKATVKISLPLRSYVETDLMERPTGKKTAIKNGQFTVSLGKHEIKTLKLLR